MENIDAIYIHNSNNTTTYIGLQNKIVPHDSVGRLSTTGMSRVEHHKILFTISTIYLVRYQFALICILFISFCTLFAYGEAQNKKKDEPLENKYSFIYEGIKIIVYFWLYIHYMMRKS